MNVLGRVRPSCGYRRYLNTLRFLSPYFAKAAKGAASFGHFDYIVGIGRHSITSTLSPGNIVKCGWFSKSFAASSADSACTTVHAPISLLVSETPLLSTRFVLPSGEPMSTMDFALSVAHLLHASIPCFIVASSGFHSCIFFGVPRNTAMYFFISLLSTC